MSICLSGGLGMRLSDAFYARSLVVQESASMTIRQTRALT